MVRLMKAKEMSRKSGLARIVFFRQFTVYYKKSSVELGRIIITR
jgi:hypothetical protein